MIGRILANLLALRTEMITSQAAIEGLKDLGLSVEEFEPLRQRYAQRYIDKTPGVEEARARAIEDLAGFMPIEAQELRWTLRSYTFLPNVSLKGYAKLDRMAYIKALSTIEASILVSRNRLGETISRLAWKYGLVTWLRLKIRERRVKKHLPKPGEKSKAATELAELLSQMKAEKAEGSGDEVSQENA